HAAVGLEREEVAARLAEVPGAVVLVDDLLAVPGHVVGEARRHEDVEVSVDAGGGGGDGAGDDDVGGHAKLGDVVEVAVAVVQEEVGLLVDEAAPGDEIQVTVAVNVADGDAPVGRVRHRRTDALLTLIDELAGAVVDPDVERSAATGVGDQIEV